MKALMKVKNAKKPNQPKSTSEESGELDQFSEQLIAKQKTPYINCQLDYWRLMLKNFR
jgi:hypothetical protein